jgi:hypothetical protein
MAIGFVTLVVAHVAYLHLFTNRVPTMLLASILGYAVGSNGELYQVSLVNGQRAARRNPAATAVARTADAVLTFVAGLVGCLIGALAHKNRPES